MLAEPAQTIEGMTITSLSENTSRTGLPAEHGLSLHIRTDDGRQILFDMGQGRLFAENAERLGVGLSKVELAVVSHGHYDHGGGLAHFLRVNNTATVYVNRHAFEPHYSLRGQSLAYIGLAPKQEKSGRVVCCEGTTRIGTGMLLFNDVRRDSPAPPGNRWLFGPARNVHDDFRHEQSLLIIEGEKTVLFAGCAHSGIENIIAAATQAAGQPPTHVFAGMHLIKSGLTEAEEAEHIRALAGRLAAHESCRYVTMHCTGLPQYARLKALLGDAISYLSCGDQMVI